MCSNVILCLLFLLLFLSFLVSLHSWHSCHSSNFTVIPGIPVLLSFLAFLYSFHSWHTCILAIPCFAWQLSGLRSQTEEEPRDQSHRRNKKTWCLTDSYLELQLLQPLRCFSLHLLFWLFNNRVAELGSLSSGAKMAMKIFVKRVFTIFALNASFLRVIANLQN